MHDAFAVFNIFVNGAHASLIRVNDIFDSIGHIHV